MVLLNISKHKTCLMFKTLYLNCYWHFITNLYSNNIFTIIVFCLSFLLKSIIMLFYGRIYCDNLPHSPNVFKELCFFSCVTYKRIGFSSEKAFMLSFISFLVEILLDVPPKWVFTFPDFKSKQRTSGFSLIECEAEDQAACPFVSLIYSSSHERRCLLSMTTNCAKKHG